MRLKQRAFSGLCLVCSVLLAACGKAPDTHVQGYVEGEFVYMGSSQAGRLTTLNVARGQQLAAGAALFALDTDNEAAAQRQAQGELAAAQAQLADLQTGQRVPELDVARAQLAEAQIDARVAASQLQRDELQMPAGGLSAALLDQSRARAAAAAARVRQLRSALVVAELPGRPAQLRAQAAQVAAASAALAQADWKLQQKTVTAPAAALVTDTLYRQGEWVAAGNPIVRLLPPQNVKVRFFVPETQLGRWRNGQPVRLHCDGCSNDIAATVSFIATEAEFTPPVIYSEENRSKLVFMLEAHPALADAGKLHPGQPVEVTPR
ncbi:Multidrug resistance protein MdtN [Andreprevotia sp. IGB-42]|uniref:HlyD family secretion protein n=1 Tax=Andreprevotia sp. IGB-42 TaxID=2497473 RepID=UPI001359C543|nr:HlyD family efflux transporter periplasmic adaptor subunit [Andreprevotia sp. IGB-42]KAF0812260.1 Multidrug resistance protein MdtN [Andreprevotia sp. IGB-42]